MKEKAFVCSKCIYDISHGEAVDEASRVWQDLNPENKCQVLLTAVSGCCPIRQCGRLMTYEKRQAE
jgi:hypothetical protein